MVINTNKTNDKLNKYEIPINNSVKYNFNQIENKREKYEKTDENEKCNKYVKESHTYNISKFPNKSETDSSYSRNYSNCYLKKSKIPKYVTKLWKYNNLTILSSLTDNRPPFKKYVTSIKKNSNIDYTVDLINIEKQIQNQIKKCVCLPRFRVHKISENNNGILYEFGNFSSIKRHVKIHNSNVTIRVGGGWESLEQFFHKTDPCRIKKKTFNKFNNTSTLLKQKSLESNFNRTFLTTTLAKEFKNSKSM